MFIYIVALLHITAQWRIYDLMYTLKSHYYDHSLLSTAAAYEESHVSQAGLVSVYGGRCSQPIWVWIHTQSLDCLCWGRCDEQEQQVQVAINGLSDSLRITLAL